MISWLEERNLQSNFFRDDFPIPISVIIIRVSDTGV